MKTNHIRFWKNKLQFKKIFDAMTDPVVIIDTHLHILYANHSAEELFSTPLKTLLGLPFDGSTIQIRHPGGKRYLSKSIPFADVIRKGKPLNPTELAYGNSEDAPVYLTTATPFETENSKINLLIITLHDISAIKEAEQQRERFVHIVGHELKHPLTSMKAYIYFLNKYLDTDPTKLKDFIVKMDNQIDVLTEMINDLVQISKVRSDQFKLSLKKTNLSQLVKNVALEQALVVPNPLVTKVDKNVLVKADSNRLRQVIVNLVTNAAKYSHTQKPITIYVKSKSNQAQIEVIDRGNGIPKQKLDKLFDPYYQIENARKNGESGMGLGLYVSKQIMLRHKGDLLVKSRVNKGSAFTLTLPLYKV